MAPDPRMLMFAAADTAVEGTGKSCGAQGVGIGAFERSVTAPGILTPPASPTAFPARPGPTDGAPVGAAAEVPARPEPHAAAPRAMAPALPGTDETEQASIGPAPSTLGCSGAKIEKSGCRGG